MTYQELYEMVPSDTLERDLKYLDETGNVPSGYSLAEIHLLYEYLTEGGEEE